MCAVPLITATPRSGAAERLAASFARCLSAAGTRVLYGMPGGGHNLDVIEACEAAGLRFVLAHGETAAAIMGAVDAELSGSPGACLATRGPGAASVVNGVAHANLDRAALAVITDAVPRSQRVRISHQRVDQNALFRPITKWSGSIGLDGADDAIGAALALATAPPPGPVHLDFVPDAPRTAAPAHPVPPRSGDRDAAARLLAASRRPVFALGVGARRAVPGLRRLLEGAPWPVLTTYKAKGVIPETWPNAAGLLTGATVEAPVLSAADLIVAIGLDPVELIPAPWPYDAPVLALGDWPVTDPYFEPRVEIVGPLDDAVALVAGALPSSSDSPPVGRVERIAAQTELLTAPTAGIGPQHIVQAARAAAPPKTTATVDSGAHMLVTMPLWEVDAMDEVLISSGLATMGFALPAAIAASLARPDRHVVCFTGDGGIGMALAELETLSRLAAPVVVVVFNDSALSLIEVKQRPSGHGGKNAVRYGDMDFARIAESVGIASRRVESCEELPAAFAEAFAEPRPFLLDVQTDSRGYRQIMAAIRGASGA
jgi:acetolactate synthase I/II/III large subunit